MNRLDEIEQGWQEVRDWHEISESRPDGSLDAAIKDINYLINKCRKLEKVVDAAIQCVSIPEDMSMDDIINLQSALQKLEGEE